MVARSLVFILLVGCAGGPRTASAPQKPSGPAPVVPPLPARIDMAAPKITLTRDLKVALGGGVTLGYADLVIEEIAMGPSAAYPAGNGVTLSLVMEGLGAPVRRPVSLLSAGYNSQREGWFERHRVTLVDVIDPHRDARVVVAVERISDEVLPGAPREVRVEAGGKIELEGAAVEFLGHSSKHISEGEVSPLMLTVRYHVPGEEVVRSDMNVGVDGGPQYWSWRDYRFTIVEYAYDAWMRVAISRLRLEPEKI